MLVKNTDVFELCITLTSNWCLYAEHSNSKMLNIYTNIFSNWCIGVKETKVRSYKQRCFELLGSKNSNSEINNANLMRKVKTKMVICYNNAKLIELSFYLFLFVALGLFRQTVLLH